MLIDELQTSSQAVEMLVDTQVSILETEFDRFVEKAQGTVKIVKCHVVLIATR